MGVEQHNSIVVQTLLSTTATTRFDRWFAAVLDALDAAVSAGVISSWRVSVGGQLTQNPLGAEALVRCEEKAQRIGGHFTYSALRPELHSTQAHEQLLGDADEDFLLVLDCDAIILASTIDRLISSLDGGCFAARARCLPVSDVGELAAIEHQSYELNYCVLHSLRAMRAHGVALNQSGSGGTAPATPTLQLSRETMIAPHAAVYRDHAARRQSEMRRIAEIPVGLGNGSLLEELFVNTGLENVEKIVAQGLITPGEEILLSVVMRTQVRRPEALRDALLCLAGQTDGRFEVLLVVHDGDSGEAVRILEDQPAWLKSRVRVIAASGGTRAHPLNEGISVARGSLVAFLDDDDVVYSHWVECFLTGADRYPRRLLRALAGVQRVEATEWPDSLQGHRSESAVSTPYPALFDLVDHLQVNMTPFMVFAFPRQFFTLFGNADESLEVCEDWDLVVRAARVLGVGNLPALTAVYHRWSTGHDSYSVHDQQSWDRDMARVREKLNSVPLIFPPGAAEEMADFAALRTAHEKLSAILTSSSWRVTAPLRRAKGWAGKLLNRRHRNGSGSI